LHTSGVLSAVACGLFLGRRSATYFSSAVRIEAWAFWSALTFMLNGLVFILIGLQLPGIYSRIQNLGLPGLIARGALLSGLVILLRFAWVFPGAHVAYFIRTRFLRQPETRPRAGGIVVVGWTGMRGVVALAAAISLPATLPQRDLILFLTFCVIFVTLVLQGLTLPGLIRRLKLPEQAMTKCEALEARTIMINAALKELEESPDRLNPDYQSVYDDVASHYQNRLSTIEAADEACAMPSPTQDQFEAVSRRLRDREREVAIELRDQDRINDEVLRDLLHELDLLDVRQAGGIVHSGD
jgi:CPA1 family monovalent cation:H+ antiporter